MAALPPPTKKPRKSPQSSKSDRPKQQLTLAQTFKRKRSIEDNQDLKKVIILDSEENQDSERFEHSPELFSDMSDSPTDGSKHCTEASVSAPEKEKDSATTRVKTLQVDSDDEFATISIVKSKGTASSRIRDATVSTESVHDDATLECSVESSSRTLSPSPIPHSSDHTERQSQSVPPLSTPIADFRSSSHSHTSSRDITPLDTTPSSGGTPLNEISYGPSTYPILPPLQPSASHAVLFRPRLKPGSLPRPFPDKFKDVWDSNHVRMPCSSQSVYPVAVSDSKEKKLLSRWEMIQQAMSAPITNSYDLEEAILSYNSRYSRKWNFKSLHRYFNDVCTEEESGAFFGVILPRIISLALELPKMVTHAVPLLKCQQEYSITLSQQQVACLLANAFLCTFPRRNASVSTSEFSNYPSINFNTLYYGKVCSTCMCNVDVRTFLMRLHVFKSFTTCLPRTIGRLKSCVNITGLQQIYPSWSSHKLMGIYMGDLILGVIL